MENNTNILRPQHSLRLKQMSMSFRICRVMYFFVDLLCFFLSCVCYAFVCARLFICVLWSPAG